MPPYSSIAFAFLLIWLIKKFVVFRANRKLESPYPPGPKPKPLIGNLLDFPMTGVAQTYVEWGKEYNSDILYATALGNRVVILNNREDAEELFEKRANKYSDRPEIPLIKLMGWGYNMTLYGYGDKWRMHRKICQQNFRPEAVLKYRPLLTKMVHKMLQSLVDTPADFEHHNKMLSISLPMMLMYGYEVKTFEDPCVVAADRSITLGAHLLLPGSSLINVFPVLAYIPKWFPGATSQKIAAEVKKLTDEMERIPMEFARKRVKEGTAIPSLVSDFLERKYSVGASIEEEEMIKNVASTVYGGASDTTISSTGTFLYAMAANPDVQKKGQAEIDLVIGSNRLPVFEDRQSLPYVEAIYREVMRFRPPAQLGIPHSLSEDDYYKGFFIPKGTTIFANIWAMTHDETVYTEPLKFKPERFLGDDGKLNNDDKILAYGFGRRVCAGKYVASSTMWLMMACVLATFDIVKSKDELGNDIEIDHSYEDFGLLNHKAKYQCSFVPRSQLARQLIADTRQP
ncbi:hypothetical protein GALMADRAFT_59888 [Galerina marginata CBS 339.88]|uniref:Cytochrome P450 n=1 Tax=Galerina marginata (strain CBS 339.88) TaxID=685588 RepID=A0A067TIP7_GALM3|nr:hypothetical protein GALMADRAFT_59888 [Galerina marginata CBS 339.88]